ncbi:PREDICTED: polycystic kidney disease protein 1-like 3 [Ipomoea nil]|uniref:polycystic kidney disease protein 1-like 3 n=1 Tax=Ipomoea nil TaxID=35883 RepID=UPI000901DA16|nr:PREDICTED: polycystic kidney disease protein 1-like 3 [Ipomoea nil]
MDSTTTSPGSDPLPAKLRFMCFYGGHIIPRPHHKSLSYVGGEKRIVAVDRGVSLAELRRHLSHTLLNGQRRFTLKYQLPHEELDSLVSIANDEDLENMVQEYDRIAGDAAAASPLRPRLRFFLFPDKPETAASAGCLLADAKSEQWFVDAINDSGLVSRAFSDPTIDINTVDRLHGISIFKDNNSCADSGLVVNISNQDVQSTPDSIASESSSASSSWKHIIHQDASNASLVTNWETTSRPSAIMDLSSQLLMHHPLQHHLLHPPPTHYIHHPTPPDPLPLSYYPIYAPPPQQPPLPHQLDQHPPLYVLPVAQSPPPYNFPANTAAAPPPNVTIIPPICAANTTTLYGPAAAAAAAPTPTTVVQVPTGNQLQAQQYLGLSQVPPSLQQPITAPASQVYYAAQCPAVAPLPSQYQTVTPATAVLISQAPAAQLPGENSMQQIVSSHPL